MARRYSNINIHFPDKIKVEEHRAPTDDSIRLAEEFREKSMERVIKHLHVENNILKADILAVIPGDLSRDVVTLVIKFSLNGNEFRITEEINRCDLDQEFYKWTGLSSKMTIDQILVVFYTQAVMKGLLTASKNPIDWKITEFMINSVRP